MNLSQRMEFATNRFIFFVDLIPALRISHKEIINVPTIQMSIFIFFVYAWVLFGVTFSLWLSLKIYSPVLLDFVRWKIVISENLRTVNHGSRIRFLVLSGSKLAINQTLTSKFVDMKSSSDFFVVALFPLSSSVSGSSFILISLLFPELLPFFFKRCSTRIQKLKIPTSEFCSIFGTGVR